MLVFGCLLGVGGVAYLAADRCRSRWPPLVAAVTFVSYVGVYTPLKRVTTLNTLVGAVPGALPPVIGWAAVRGTIDAEAVALFLILFLWQVPHFLAIAWIYREEYARAGLRMLPVVDPRRQLHRPAHGRLLPGPDPRQPAAGAARAAPGWLYLGGALLLGLGFLATRLALPAAGVRRAGPPGAAGLAAVPARPAGSAVAGRGAWPGLTAR